MTRPMVAVELTFISRRFHATPWGRHVNEGILEWPPSPWRLLRAVVATWRWAHPEMPAAQVVPILQALASEMPRYHLPLASSGHTRHYMPYNEGAKERKVLVLDSFVAIQPEAKLTVMWPNTALNLQHREALDRILRSMPYLGRAESWVEAALVPDQAKWPEPNAYALETGTLPEGNWEVVPTLVPRHPLELRHLEVETAALRKSGSIDPPGAQWQLYVRRDDCFTEFMNRPVGAPRHTSSPTVVRFALAGKVLPMAFDTLRWGDLARKCALAQFGRQNGGAKSAILSGKDPAGKPLKDHLHAFYLPADEDGDGKLDHLTIWVPGGLDEQAYQAVVSIKTLNPGRGQEPVTLVYQAHGDAPDFEDVSPLFGQSKRWRSLTPYVLTQHIKFRGPRNEQGQKRMVNGPVEQIEREVQWRCHGHRLQQARRRSPNEAIASLDRGRHRGFRPIEFFRYRQRGSSGGGAFNFCIEFQEPISGPLALGFSCHFGLGLFVPMDE